MSPRLIFALETVYRAGKFTLAHFNANTKVELKADDSPVTVADRGAERIIREAIEREYPGESILGEEEGFTEGTNGRWVLDPIDGTKSFVCGVSLFATLLAYEDEQGGQLGVCYFPALEEVVYAERGHGTFWNGKQCRVSAHPTVKNATLSCGSHSSMAKQGHMSSLLKLAEQTQATRTWSDAYGHALVATGRIEAMIDPIVSHWDIAAMAIIVREAGGRFTTMDGGEALGNEALSSNGLFHQELVEAFSR
ncbi:MAG: hypothetical protein KF784_02465 [Fimbriimonadaceae bacterium]|nr:hypothetical protein [Fimbriimonadaceae bacterium]